MSDLSFGEKIKEARKAKKYTQKELAQMIGAAHNSVSDWENNKNKPDPDTIEILCGVLDITPNYLLASSPDEFSPLEKLLIKKYRSLDPTGQETVNIILDREADRVKQITELEAKATVIDITTRFDSMSRLTGYYREVSAGSGIFIMNNEATSKIALSESDWDERVDYVIKISGDSMEPDYCDGDNVLVSQRVEMRHGDIGIFVVDGNAYIKEYGETELISRNPDSPNIKISEYSNVVCMGKVIGKVNGEYEIIDE